RPHALPIFHPAAGVEDDFLAFLQAFDHLGFGAAGVADLNDTQVGAAIGNDIGGPLVALAEQSASRDLQGLLGFPHDDARFDAEIVADVAALLERSDEVGDDIHALLLHAESGDFGEGGGFDQTHTANQRFAAAPL